jgi:Rrf2 family transcriptional regulator, nitric oxide-sensitive transcriptional repressor
MAQRALSRLAKPAEAISLGEVVRHTEPDMAIVMCFEPIDAHCAIRPSCVLRRALERARVAFVEVLDSYTLRDLVKPRASLRTLLSIAPSDDKQPSSRIRGPRGTGVRRMH